MRLQNSPNAATSFWGLKGKPVVHCLAVACHYVPPPPVFNNPEHWQKLQWMDKCPHQLVGGLSHLWGVIHPTEIRFLDFVSKPQRTRGIYGVFNAPPFPVTAFLPLARPGTRLGPKLRPAPGAVDWSKPKLPGTPALALLPMQRSCWKNSDD